MRWATCAPRVQRCRTRWHYAPTMQMLTATWVRAMAEHHGEMQLLTIMLASLLPEVAHLQKDLYVLMT